jgi:hypothetical protein
MKLRGGILFLVLFFPLVSSTIIVENGFDEVYSVGDLINVSFSIERSIEVRDFVEVILDCGSDEFTLKKDYVLVEPDIKRVFSFESPLSIEGDCRIKVLFVNEEVTSEEFEVSDYIYVDYSLNDKFFYPLENLTINGTVKKANGENYFGAVNLKIEGLEEKTAEVIDGKFNFGYIFPKKTIPKEYNLEISVVERNFLDEVLNEGVKRSSIEVRPKATYLEVDAEEVVVPASEFNFSVVVLDQMENFLPNESVVVKLKNPLGDVIFQGSYISRENISYKFSSDSLKGGWNLYSYSGNLVEVHPVYVDENMELKQYISLNVLKFENVGNVPYEGVIEVTVDNTSFGDKLYLNVSIPVGETYEYPLYYVGSYNLTLNGEKFSGVHLTGHAISDNFDLDWKAYAVFLGVLLFLFFVWFFVFKKKIFRKLEKEEVHNRQDFAKEVAVIPPTKKIKVREVPEEEVGPVNKKTYALFFESSEKADIFSSIIENYGYKMNKVSENVAYTIFYEKEGVNSELKLYNLAKAIKRFALVRGGKVSIVINRGQFEGKLSLLKKFALLNRSLLKYVEGKILMTQKFYDLLGINDPKQNEVIEVMDRKLKVCLV